jgi:hypothetical protein
MNETITLKRDKETKNKIRFSNESTAKVSGSIYVDKEVAGAATEITVVITSK